MSPLLLLARDVLKLRLEIYIHPPAPLPFILDDLPTIVIFIKKRERTAVTITGVA
jgi:hypothetical protein